MSLDKIRQSEQEFLAHYNPKEYPRPSLAVDMAVFTVSGQDPQNYRKLPTRELRVLLVRRGGHPYMGHWALPGGFVRPGETVAMAAGRELQEETGVEGIYLEQLYTFSKPDRDPRTWVISCTHMALVDSNCLQLQGGDDAAEAAWFHLLCANVEPTSTRYHILLENGGIYLDAVVDTCGHAEDGEGYQIISNNGLAFDHAKILLYALLRLRARVESTTVAFHLVPGLFTLTQLQQVYELILGRPLLAAAFRRKVAGLVEETDQFTANAGHRPSRLFKKKDQPGLSEG